MSDDRLDLSDVLADFARTMITDFPIGSILDRLLERIVQILPISSAGVTIVSAGAARSYLAASDPAALRFEELQSETGDGPAIAALRGDGAVAVTDLAVDARFPHFAGLAVPAGLVAVFTFPLRHGDQPLGALNLYRHTAGELSDPVMTAAQTLADVAAAYLLNAQTRTALQDNADRSRQAALHDTLTGLPNRALLLDRLQHALHRSARSSAGSAVLFADLDRFKRVNDRHGHTAGDQLLVAVATRLSQQLRSQDTMGRLSGDEFVMICEDLADIDEAAAIGARMATAVREAFSVAAVATPLQITVSIGIAFTDRPDTAPERLLRDADMAMYQARRKGGNRHHVFNRRQQQLDDQQASLESDLQHALPLGQLHTAYQPIVAAVPHQQGALHSADRRRIAGFEALLRWNHPTRGLVPPTTLIPLAEQSGLITSIGHWVLQHAWTDRERWNAAAPEGEKLSMSVNVSTHQLMSIGFADTVRSVVASSESDAASLTLEVTESVFVRDSDRALAVLNDLKSIGVAVALDDFGTGYSSLSYLRRFPVDIVKIDQSFVAELGHDFTSHAIIEAVVKLAHALGMTVVAEGVETQDQQGRLIELGCDYFQGYYFARPMPATSVDSLLTGGEYATPAVEVNI